MPVLSNLDVPQLWILAAQDRDAPPMETLRRLTKLRNNGRPITTAVFPNGDHGMYEFEISTDGERVSTRQPDGYFQMMRDCIQGKPPASNYGSAEISSCAAPSANIRIANQLGLQRWCTRSGR